MYLIFIQGISNVLFICESYLQLYSKIFSTSTGQESRHHILLSLQEAIQNAKLYLQNENDISINISDPSILLVHKHLREIVNISNAISSGTKKPKIQQDSNMLAAATFINSINW